MMSFNKGCIKFNEFFKIVYDAATAEPHAKWFKELSARGDREGMIKILVDLPYIENIKIAESYRGKDDIKAAELYTKSRTMVAKAGNMHEEESRSSILIETLFTASVTSELFLDALLDCAQYCYGIKAFAKCIKYCECMLALPETLYNETVESMNNFMEHRSACIQLERECSKKLKVSSSQDKRRNKKCNGNRNLFTENTFLANPMRTIPVVDGKHHTLLKSCTDALTLRYDEKRGKHLIANRNIKAGTVLIVEAPFAFSTNNEALDRNCLHCHVAIKSHDNIKIPCYFCQTAIYCSEKCRTRAWKSYHEYECSILDTFYESIYSEQNQQHTSHLLLAYRMTIAGFLSSSSKLNKDNTERNEISFLNDTFLQHCVANTNKQCNNLGISEVYSPHDYHTILNLETHCADMDPSINLNRAIEAIFLAKCFIFVLSKKDIVCTKKTYISLAVATLHHLQVINCNAYEIVENIYDKRGHVWEPRNVGGAIYPSVSLINHSCYPNIVRHSYPSGVVVVRALRFIGKDTEILDCYGSQWFSEGRLSRREYLWKKYRFLCSCEACSQNWHYPIPGTMNYKCKFCSENIGTIPLNADAQNVLSNKCPKCMNKIDYKKISKQFRKSVDKRQNAISKMYEGEYETALFQLLEHIQFIEKCFTAPNMETIKSQQCIIQCYNQFGCISQ